MGLYYIHRLVRMGLVVSMALAATACTETQFLAAQWKEHQPPSNSQGLFKVGKPYSIAGTSYRPSESYSYDETGIASWYGPGFHGKSTANGEEFSTDELTAAHRTLQLPSLVRVTNLENGRSVILRVNDRGPFAKGRIIDVSKKAADLLAFRNRGTARVRVQVLAEESRQMAAAAKRGVDTRGMEVALNQAPPAQAPIIPPPTEMQPTGFQTATYTPPEPVETEVLSAPEPSARTVYTPSGVQGHTAQNGRFYPDPVVQQFPVTPTGLYIQAGAFGNPDNAKRVASSLTGLGPVRVRPVVVHGQQYFRVQVGPVQAVDTADSLLSQVVNRGYPDARITVDNSS